MHGLAVAPPDAMLIPDALVLSDAACSTDPIDKIVTLPRASCLSMFGAPAQIIAWPVIRSASPIHRSKSHPLGFSIAGTEVSHVAQALARDPLISSK